jgi:hypothetical protein
MAVAVAVAVAVVAAALEAHPMLWDRSGLAQTH